MLKRIWGIVLGIADVDGATLPSGIYTASRLPAHVTGGGTLKIGESGTLVIFR